MTDCNNFSFALKAIEGDSTSLSAQVTLFRTLTKTAALFEPSALECCYNRRAKKTSKGDIAQRQNNNFTILERNDLRSAYIDFGVDFDRYSGYGETTAINKRQIKAGKC